MAQNQAVKTVSAGNARVVDVLVPGLPAADYLLVKTSAVAINPTDWKHVEAADHAGCVGSWVGCDYSGVVVEVGPGVTKGFKVGDRICGPVNGSNALREVDGSFARYIVVKSDLQILIPDNLSDEQAATLGIAITTVGQALYQTLKLPLPTSPAEKSAPILINGGSTAMGIFGIQYAKLSGFSVITTASPHNFNFVKSLGADIVFDYRIPTVSKDIREYTQNGLTLAWDCQSTEESGILCAKALSTKGGSIANLLPISAGKVLQANPHVKIGTSLYYTVAGEPFGFFQTYEANAQDLEFGKMFWELSRGLLANGKVKPPPVILNKGGSGLQGVLVGLQESKSGKVSGGKLVYTL
ncbi:TOXD [Colletotrichum limetticola]|uniref:TOXD n=1 Tax=Colletotrichum limetticola TaxID=1209924 RepID=A0ABQ9PL61_9PEZI|nr:TOXD [Colletotrichum limetticola]